MKNVLAVALLAASAGIAHAGVNLAYWAFPATVPPSADNFKILFPLNADFKLLSGAANITTDAAVWDGSATPPNSVAQGNFQYFSGDAINLQAGFVNGSRFSVRGNTGNIMNGKSITFRFDTTGYKDIVLTYAERTTSTGATSLDFSTSPDGTTFTAATSVTTTRDSTFRLRTIDLSAVAAIENTGTAYVKITFPAGYSSASGSVAFDNILFAGDLVPAPGALALLGLGGIVAGRRRR